MNRKHQSIIFLNKWNDSGVTYLFCKTVFLRSIQRVFLVFLMREHYFYNIKMMIKVKLYKVSQNGLPEKKASIWVNVII
jgi:hypothetical protein